MKKRRARDVVRVRVPLDQSPFVFLPGAHGGWFVSLLYGHGTDVDVDVAALRDLIAGSRGSVVIAHRLAGAELRLLQSYLDDIGAEVHARIVSCEEVRFRRSPGRR